MDDKKPNNINIENYYSSVDKNFLENICSNTNIKNLIHLSSQMDFNPFNKKNKKWQLKSKDKLIKECEQVKKKELKEFSTALSNLAKLESNNTLKVKDIYKSFENKLENLDKIITCANCIEGDISQTNQLNQTMTNQTNQLNQTNTTTYIVTHEPNSQSNIVSFDIIGGKQEIAQKAKSTKSQKTKPKSKIVEIKARKC